MTIRRTKAVSGTLPTADPGDLGKQRGPKRSIQRQILLIFAVALLVTWVACSVFGYRSAYAITERQGRTYAASAAYLTALTVSEYGLDALSDPANAALYAEAREVLQEICGAYYLEYLYLYTVDEAGVRHFVFTVSSDEALDRVAAEQRGLGAVSTSPLRPQEAALLRDEEPTQRWDMDNQFGAVITWAAPYREDGGRVLALIGMDYNMQENSALVLRRFASVTIPVLSVLLVTFAALFALLRRRVIAPLRTISRQMDRFDPAQPGEPLRINSQDEMRQIADAFEKMSGDIRAYIDNLTRITAEREQARAQMDVARRIQYGMVPEAFHREAGGVEVAASMQPARAVGGDFYDCFALDNGRYCGVIGDVSGKGVTAALFMAMVKSMLRDHLKLGLDPAAALNLVNDELCDKNPECLFATVFAFSLDPKTGALQYANGGHNAPLLLRPGGAEYLNPDPGIALGLFEDAGIANGETVLAPGEGILLYTDGITEAVNAEKQFYGTERLRELLSGPAARDSRTAVAAVNDAVRAFFDGCEQFDDMTLLALRRL